MKVEQLQQILKKRNIDAAIFYNSSENKRDKSIFYFTGIDTEFSFLVIPRNDEPILVIGALEEEIVRKNSKIKKIIALNGKFSEFLSKKMKKYNTIGVNYSIFSLNDKKFFKKHLKIRKFVDISKDVMNLRIQKDSDELEKIRKACNITDNIFSEMISNFNFKNEKDIEMFISDYARKNDCTLSFSPIIANGKNASMPHYKENNCDLNKGFLLLDFGVNYKGYCSDITRTIYLGNPSDNEVCEYYNLLGVQEQAINELKKDISFKKLDESVKKVLGKNFIHSLGHGLGIDVHESISIDKNLKLNESVVLTIEPGIYYPNKFGIRIEDDVLITKKGHEVLTKSKKDLIIIGIDEKNLITKIKDNI